MRARDPQRQREGAAWAPNGAARWGLPRRDLIRSVTGYNRRAGAVSGCWLGLFGGRSTDGNEGQMLRIGLAEDFAAKAKANAKFVVSALQELGPKALKGTGEVPTLGFQIANQLIMEGIELALKAMMLARERKPPSTHKLACLYGKLDDADRSFVDEAVREAVLQTATGQVPLGLSNFVSVTLRGSDGLGQGDPASGYKEMDAQAIFL